MNPLAQSILLGLAQAPDLGGPKKPQSVLDVPDQIPPAAEVDAGGPQTPANWTTTVTTPNGSTAYNYAAQPGGDLLLQSAAPTPGFETTDQYWARRGLAETGQQGSKPLSYYMSTLFNLGPGGYGSPEQKLLALQAQQGDIAGAQKGQALSNENLYRMGQLGVEGQKLGLAEREGAADRANKVEIAKIEGMYKQKPEDVLNNTLLGAIVTAGLGRGDPWSKIQRDIAQYHGALGQGPTPPLPAGVGGVSSPAAPAAAAVIGGPSAAVPAGLKVPDPNAELTDRLAETLRGLSVAGPNGAPPAITTRAGVNAAVDALANAPNDQVRQEIYRRIAQERLLGDPAALGDQLVKAGALAQTLVGPLPARGTSGILSGLGGGGPQPYMPDPAGGAFQLEPNLNTIGNLVRGANPFVGPFGRFNQAQTMNGRIVPLDIADVAGNNQRNSLSGPERSTNERRVKTINPLLRALMEARVYGGNS